jgi:hypothetical protein
MLYGDNIAELNEAEAVLISLAANGPNNVGMLVDDQGRSWPGVYVASATPIEDVTRLGAGYSRLWQIAFEHLV